MVVGWGMYRVEIVVMSGSRQGFGLISALLGSSLQIIYAQSYDFGHNTIADVPKFRCKVLRRVFSSLSQAREVVLCACR